MKTSKSKKFIVVGSNGAIVNIDDISCVRPNLSKERHPEREWLIERISKNEQLYIEQESYEKLRVMLGV